MVRVLFSSAVRASTNGEKEVELPFAGTVAELMQALAERYGATFESRLMERGELRRYINVYVDDKDIRFLQGAQTRVGDGSTVLLMPAVSGG